MSFHTLATQLSKVITLIGLMVILCFTTSASAVVPQEGSSYFTKHNIFFEKSRHVTTNYTRGQLLPINTKVTVVEISAKRMKIESKYGAITLVNAKKHTKKTMAEIADRFLAQTPQKIQGKYANDIISGEMRLGMSKEQVIMTRGYPPAHKTYSTESDRWIYWTSKFVQRTLVFENNRLTRGRGLR